MQKVFESKLNVFDEVAEQITIYHFEPPARRCGSLTKCSTMSSASFSAYTTTTARHLIPFTTTTTLRLQQLFLIITDYVACNV